MEQQFHKTFHYKISYLLPNKKETNNDDLNFYVAKYYYNGTFFKFDKLENDFLQCSNSNDEKINFKRFGNNQYLLY